MRMKKRVFTAALALIISVTLAAVSHAADAGEVILGGNAFGVRLSEGRLIVVALEDVETENGRVCPAGDAGIVEGDEIAAINGEPVANAAEFAKQIEKSGGGDVTLSIKRGGSELEIAVAPAKSVPDGKARLGVWVKDSTAGVGTMTFVVPDTLAFGALGHSIGGTDGESDETQSRGELFGAAISDVKRGQSGSPGELQGTFGAQKIGAVVVNCEDGIFGVCAELPAELDGSEVIELCPAAEVHEGAARLYCTLGDDGVRGYDVRISDISEDAEAERSFVVTVTDPKLIERTGGIVQGMSGSPLVQDGRLIGAVTHVMVSDPTNGFGIFIGNMLDDLPAVLR